jgi:hypothetical protein
MIVLAFIGPAPSPAQAWRPARRPQSHTSLLDHHHDEYGRQDQRDAEPDSQRRRFAEHGALAMALNLTICIEEFVERKQNRVDSKPSRFDFRVGVKSPPEADRLAFSSKWFARWPADTGFG